MRHSAVAVDYLQWLPLWEFVIAMIGFLLCFWSIKVDFRRDEKNTASIKDLFLWFPQCTTCLYLMYSAHRLRHKTKVYMDIAQSSLYQNLQFLLGISLLQSITLFMNSICCQFPSICFFPKDTCGPLQVTSQCLDRNLIAPHTLHLLGVFFLQVSLACLPACRRLQEIEQRTRYAYYESFQRQLPMRHAPATVEI